METLFTIQPSNTHQSLLLAKPEEMHRLALLNQKSLAENWIPLSCKLETCDKNSIEIPSICTLYISGLIAFRAELRDALFPTEKPELELLPIRVADQPWLVVNCLASVVKFDEKKSQIMRDESKQIFMILRLQLDSASVNGYEMFTLDESNRAQVFVTESFRDRVQGLNLKGITFQSIGEIQ
jgi:hypothetical protein